ncbi:MAG: response regulator transcription factor [Clostridiales Family XIII bacterium]|jgi:DNA-binding response OmpR family regulator|nr:response regulator transcription factor [Clostridiales Family XIII bacterium]
MTKIPILVVEDDAAINRLLCEALSGAGYDPAGAFSGSEALLALDAKPWKCVILDLMLPGKPGGEVLQAIRKRANVPVVVLSAKTDKESKLELLGGGADDYITKPFDVDELLARVSALLRRFTEYAACASEGELSYLDIRMNPDAREVTVGGEAVHLTLREYELLRLFLRHPRKVYSRSNLYESVWGADFFGDERTVNVHVSNLRAKLNGLSPHKHIRAVWGVGFRLAE